MSPQNKTLDQANITTAFLECVQQTIQRMGALTYTSDPVVAAKDLIEYHSRMRTPGLSKFNEPCYVASVSFYTSEQSMQSGDPVGTLVFYVEESATGKFLKGVGFKDFSEDDEPVVREKTAEFCTIIAQELKKILADFGMDNIVISKPVTGKNEIDGGVAFDYNEYKYLEYGFFLWKQKTLVFDLTLSKLKLSSK